MKELDIVGIIKHNFGDRIDLIEEEEMPKSIYEILRSPKYNDTLRRLQRKNCILNGYTVSKVCIVYKGTRVIIEFTLPFDFYNEFLNGICNREGRVIVPIVDLNEISIEEPQFTNKINKEWFDKKVQYIKFDATTGKFRKFSLTSLVVRGHRKYCSGKNIKPRILSYFEYLLGALDYAKIGED